LKPTPDLFSSERKGPMLNLAWLPSLMVAPKASFLVHTMDYAIFNCQLHSFKFVFPQFVYGASSMENDCQYKLQQ
jgi:hypothetical protein